MTNRQKAWLDHYAQGHSPAEAAQLAGYRAGKGRTFRAIGEQNCRKLAPFLPPDAREESPSPVADMAEIHAFWTALMRDASESATSRLKASELCARVAGGFPDKGNAPAGLPVVIGGEADLAD